MRPSKPYSNYSYNSTQMNQVHISINQQFPPNNLTLKELLEAIKVANSHLIEQMEVHEQENNQLSVVFQLVHLFREFHVPQISGEFLVDSKRNKDGGVEYSARSVASFQNSKLNSLVVCMNKTGNEVILNCDIELDERIPMVVVTGAKRILRLAMEATSRYVSIIIKE
jgi:hypothetical protein